MLQTVWGQAAKRRLPTPVLGGGRRLRVNRKYSLKRNRDFRYVYRKGKSYGSRLMVLLVASSREPLPQIGFCVSKKVGNSVVRNRVKRRMKEALRSHIFSLQPRVAVVFVARPSLANASYAEIASAVAYLLRKSGLLGNDPKSSQKGTAHVRENSDRRAPGHRVSD